MLSTLQKLSQWVDDHPPSSQSLRYGNPAFRDWFDRMACAAPDLLRPVLPPSLQPAVAELSPYLVHSFGNRTRIDYGTGHETTFVALLYCLAVLGVVGEDDCQALVTRVFAAYLQLMRKIQTTYWCAVHVWGCVVHRGVCTHIYSLCHCLLNDDDRKKVCRTAIVECINLQHGGASMPIVECINQHPPPPCLPPHFTPIRPGWNQQARMVYGAWTTTSFSPSCGAPRSWSATQCCARAPSTAQTCWRKGQPSTCTLSVLRL